VGSEAATTKPTDSPSGKVSDIWGHRRLFRCAGSMRLIRGNRQISPNRPPRSLRVAGSRRKWTDGTRENVAESAASPV